MIPQIKKLLYATDLSKNFSFGFSCAVDIAKKYDAKIVVFHAIAPLPYMDEYVASAGISMEDQLQRGIIGDIQKLLHEFCRKVETKIGPPCLSLISNILVCDGQPAKEILKAADEEECDAIILGSYEKGLLRKVLGGSVSHEVLTQSRKPVVIIPLPL